MSELQEQYFNEREKYDSLMRRIYRPLVHRAIKILLKMDLEKPLSNSDRETLEKFLS
jgi:hypothetical protein